MKRALWFCLIGVISISIVSAKKKNKKDTKKLTDSSIQSYDWKKPYSAEWGGLKKQPIPEWMLDAKFGIYTHWGIFSVPAHGGPDYVKSLYTAGDKDVRGTKAYHRAKYGRIKDFGYKDFVPMFTAEKFDAKEWVSVMKEGGVKFAGICLSHHDGFCLWDTKYTDFNSMQQGPKRDIYGEIAKEVRNADLKLAATFHMARTYGYVLRKNRNKFTPYQKENWDIFKDENSNIYLDPEKMPKEEYGKRWSGQVREVIDKYRPDVLWFDGISGSIKNNEVPEDSVTSIFKYYYNKKGVSGDEVVICNKLPGSKMWNFPLGFGLRCYENCRDMEEDPKGYWLADRAIGYPWCYVNNKKYRQREDYQTRSLIDIVSRGGIFFISLTPKGDGSIPEEEVAIMKGMGDWLKKNGEAIYNTRRWKISGEGTAKMLNWSKNKHAYRWNFHGLSAEDIRFTRSKDMNKIYATVLGNPKSHQYTIKCMKRGEKLSTKNKIDSIEFLATGEKVKWERTAEGLTIYFPKNTAKIDDIANAFKITVKGKLIL
ncbi:alpha-L-fucosidase [Halosquirtibacter laminarini]|uniref:Alpha-L-fucosidase n=1 Tax=Halosquirtibacter laminarini TaxID=3374600 RepID=A0AC61NHZ2_9BACT|nr:alpha-L-fucosidase [Prolixibacteraceae bacterium]